MNMDGKTVLITGSTDGVGRYVAGRLAAAGAKVLIHGRDSGRGKALADGIRREGRGEAVFYQADLSSLAGARQLAEAVPITAGSTFSSAVPASDRRTKGRRGRSARTDMSCVSRSIISPASCLPIGCCRCSRQVRHHASSTWPRSASTRSISTMS